MSTYEITTPTSGAECDVKSCRSAAVVSMIIPPARREAEGLTVSVTRDNWRCCDLHWPAFRDATLQSGHKIVDSSGDLDAIAADFPQWHVWQSDTGRLYATSGSLTLDAWLIRPLRTQIAQREATASKC